MSKCIDANEIDWYKEQRFPGLHVKDVVTTRENKLLSLHYARLEPGGAIVEDIHPQQEVYYFLKGTGEAKVNDKVYRVKDESILIVESNEVHSVRNIGSKDLYLLAVVTPPYA